MKPLNDFQIRLLQLILTLPTFGPGDHGWLPDPTNTANSRNNAVGPKWYRAQYVDKWIVSVGSEPQHHGHRRGGRAQVYQATALGRRVALAYLAVHPDLLDAAPIPPEPPADQLELWS